MKNIYHTARGVVTSSFILVLFGCSEQTKHTTEIWQGPHPQLEYSSFIFVLDNPGTDTVRAEGFWLNQNQFQAQFPVEIIRYTKDSIHVGLPSWNCKYAGAFDADRGKVIGHFSCEGEADDSVTLTTLKPEDVYGVFQGTSTSVYKAASLASFNQDLLNSFLEKVENDGYGQIHSVLIGDGQNVFLERYYQGYSRDILHAIESVNKSITALLVAMAIQDFPTLDLDTKLVEIPFATTYSLSTISANLTIVHLLQMSSGLHVDETGVLWAEDRLAFALARPQIYEPGSVWQYDGGNTVLLSRAVHAITGMPLDRYAEANLFNDLDIRNYDWRLHKQGIHPLPSGSLWLRPLDMLKVGQLVLNHGGYQAKQILDSTLIDIFTGESIQTGIDSDEYTCHWWKTPLGSDHGDMIWANGIGSQFILIFPQQDLVFVITGANYARVGEKSWEIIEGIKELVVTGESYSSAPPPGVDIY